MFRQDRIGNIGGGVLILVKDDIIASEQKQFQTDFVIFGLELVGTRPLHIAAYYRPKENDAYSADEFRRSLEMVSKEKGDIWDLGDLKYPKLDWDKDDVPYIKAGCAHTKLLIVSLRLCQISILDRWCVTLLYRVISWICS